MRRNHLLLATGIVLIFSLPLAWFLFGGAKETEEQLVPPAGAGAVLPAPESPLLSDEGALADLERAAAVSDPPSSEPDLDEGADPTEQEEIPPLDADAIADMPLGELLVLQRELPLQLNSMTEPIYEELARAGGLAWSSTQLAVTNEDHGLLLRLEYDVPSDQYRKIIIPEAEYPEAYELRRMQDLVNDRIRELEKKK